MAQLTPQEQKTVKKLKEQGISTPLIAEYIRKQREKNNTVQEPIKTTQKSEDTGLGVKQATQITANFLGARIPMPEGGGVGPERLKGIAKSVGGAIVGGAELAGQAMSWGMSKIPGIGKYAPDMSPENRPEALKAISIPSNEYQEQGKFIGDIAQFFAPTPFGKTKAVTKGLSIGGKLIKGLKAVGTEALKGTTISSAQQGEVNSESLGVGALSGATPLLGAGVKLGGKGLSKIFNIGKNIFGESAENLMKRAEWSGVSLPDINAAIEKTGISDNYITKLVKSAQTAQKTRKLGTVRPLEVVSSDLSTFFNKIKDLRKVAGKEIGEQAQAIKAEKIKSSTEPLIAPLTDRLRNLNIKVGRGGKLDFTKSDISGNTTDQKVLTKIFNTISGKDNQGKIMPKQVFVRDLIALKRSLQSILKTGKSTGESVDASKGIIQMFSSGLNDMINEVAEKTGKTALKSSNKTYSELSNIITESKKLTGTGGKDTTAGLRRLFGTTGGREKEILQKIDALAKQYGIEEGQNIFNKASLAQSLENVFRIPKTTSLEGVVERVVPTKSNIISGALNTLQEGVIGTGESNIVKILSMPKQEIAKMAMENPKEFGAMLVKAGQNLMQGLASEATKD